MHGWHAARKTRIPANRNIRASFRRRESEERAWPPTQCAEAGHSLARVLKSVKPINSSKNSTRERTIRPADENRPNRKYRRESNSSVIDNDFSTALRKSLWKIGTSIL